MNCGDMWSSSAGRSNRCDTPESVPRPPARPCSERYSALMRHAQHIHLLLVSVLLTSLASAQTTDRQAADGAPAEDAILAARSQYTQATSVSSDADNKTLAQFPRGGPGRRPSPPRGRYPRERYQTPWMDHGGAGHIVIGAAIGFFVGAALGANQSAHNGTPVSGGIIVGGGLLGLIGGCVGKAVGDLQGVPYASVRRRRTSRPSGPEEDEQSDLRWHSKPREDHPSVSAKPASPGKAAGVDALEP
jgi:hypothetical protein